MSTTTFGANDFDNRAAASTAAVLAALRAKKCGTMTMMRSVVPASRGASSSACVGWMKRAVIEVCLITYNRELSAKVMTIGQLTRP